MPFILAGNVANTTNSAEDEKGYLLKPGHIIKLGRAEYLVLESFNGKNAESARDLKVVYDPELIFDATTNKI